MGTAYTQGQAVPAGARLSRGRVDSQGLCASSQCAVDLLPNETPPTPGPLQPMPPTPSGGMPPVPGQFAPPGPTPAAPPANSDLRIPAVSVPQAFQPQTQCEAGICGPAVGSPGLGFSGGAKTETSAGMPVDAYWARAQINGYNARHGGPRYASMHASDQDWNTQGIEQLRSTPQFGARVAQLRPMFGDAAVSVATNEMANANGMAGAYADSQQMPQDYNLRHAAATQAQMDGLAWRNTQQAAAMFGIDPAMFGGTMLDAQPGGATVMRTPGGIATPTTPLAPTAPLDYVGAHFGGPAAYLQDGRTARAAGANLALNGVKVQGALDRELVKGEARRDTVATRTDSNESIAETKAATALKVAEAKAAADAAKQDKAVLARKELVAAQEAERNKRQAMRSGNKGRAASSAAGVSLLR